MTTALFDVGILPRHIENNTTRACAILCTSNDLIVMLILNIDEVSVAIFQQIPCSSVVQLAAKAGQELAVRPWILVPCRRNRHFSIDFARPFSVNKANWSSS
jgi:hypothetical protein